MAGKIKVGLDPSTGDYCVVVHGDLNGSFSVSTPTVGARFLGELNAVGNGDGTISVQNTARNSGEIANVGFATFVDASEVQFGVDEASTVNALNSIFHASGGTAPTITSAAAISAMPGGSVNYQILADQTPIIYTASALPTGLILNGTTGQIIGSAPVAGVYPFTVTAANHFGSDTQTVTLTSTAAYSNTLSTRFVKTNTNRVEAAVPVPAPGDAWTHSVWVEPPNKDCGIVFHGGKIAAEGWVIHLLKGGGRKIEIIGGDVDRASDWVRWRSAAGGWAKNAWQHIVVTYDGTLPLDSAGLTVYVDGIDVTGAGAEDDSGSYASVAWPADALVYGEVPDEDSFDGHIDEPSVWSKALSAGEVAALRSAGVPADLSGHAAYVASCDAWYRAGDGDTFPTWADQTANANDATMFNMTAGAFETDVP